MYLKKVKEQYTMHTREVTTTDTKGKKHTKIETYYTWDKVATIKKESTKVTFLGLEYDYNKFKLPSAKYIKTIKKYIKIHRLILTLLKVCFIYAPLKATKQTVSFDF